MGHFDIDEEIQSAKENEEYEYAEWLENLKIITPEKQAIIDKLNQAGRLLLEVTDSNLYDSELGTLFRNNVFNNENCKDFLNAMGVFGWESSSLMC